MVDLTQAISLTQEYIKDHSDELSLWVNQERIEELQMDLEEVGYFSDRFQRFYFPLLRIKSTDYRGTIWIEVTCESQVKLNSYIEEI